MRDELLAYYERELAYVRQLGAEFANKYPKVASRLLLEPSRCEDPHVERLLEAFAFLAARVHLKLDDEFPEVTQALLSILYPHFLRPVPSMTVVEFTLDPKQGKLTTGLKVPRGSTIYARPVNGYRCPFRTTADTWLWPIDVSYAQWTTPERLDPPIKAPDCAGAMRLKLKARGDLTFSKLKLERLRFFLNGEPSLVYPLYEMLANATLRIIARDADPKSRVRPIEIPISALRPIGFGEDEGMIPYSRRSFQGYRLLQEYFCFPEKFLFLELEGLEALEESGCSGEIELLFLFAPTERQDWEPILQMGVSSKTIRLQAAPAINLFQQTADPIMVENTRHEYPIVPDVRRGDVLEVFSVEEVVATNPRTMEVVPFEPFFSYRHSASNQQNSLFWYASRRQGTTWQGQGSDLYLTLVDLEGRGRTPDFDTITVRTLCTNRELPSRLQMGNEDGDFELDAQLPVQKVTALRKPSPTVRPVLGSASFWRLISHLSLNYLSLVEEGKEALQEILRLYAPSAPGSTERQIDGILSVSSRRHFARVVDDAGIAFVRGTRVDLTLDEDYFVGASAFLFSGVVDRFLGAYVSLNSFSQLEVRTRQRREVLRRWPVRAGQTILL
ncbi:MAG: type VI secretion system baseplate subunit TssF [Bryobacteraceae bacterium]|nr:type VI secretion system baseplate subunit TssF [Bryobacteraceae bacterium]